MSKWELKTIGDISSEIYSGLGVTKFQINTGNYPSIKYSDVFNHDVQIEECR